MEANNKTKDDGSAESPTSVLEDEVCFVFFFVFFALFGSRDYEGKWRLGKQKGNIIKKKKSVKRNSLKKWHFFFFWLGPFSVFMYSLWETNGTLFFFEVGIFCLKGCVCVPWRFLSLVYWVSPRTVIEMLVGRESLGVLQEAKFRV